jgi:hypothetical protein
LIDYRGLQSYAPKAEDYTMTKKLTMPGTKASSPIPRNSPGKRLANRQRYTQKEVFDALVKAAGSHRGAARILQCDPKTIWNYVHRFPELKNIDDALKDQRDRMARALINSGLRSKNQNVAYNMAKFIVGNRNRQNGAMVAARIDRD